MDKKNMICRCVPRRPRKTKKVVKRKALPGVGVITPMVTRTAPVAAPTPASTGVLQAPVRAAAREIATQTDVGAGPGGQTVLAFTRKPKRTAREIADEKARIAAKAAGLEADSE